MKKTNKNSALIRRGVLLNIMRIFIFLFWITSFGFTPDSLFSQNEKIIIDTDRNISVDAVFQLIKERTNYRFIYQADMFKGSKVIKLDKGEISIRELLKKSLAKGRYKLNYDKNTIVITEAKIQQTRVTGTVTDENGTQLFGVNVVVLEDMLDEGNFIRRGTFTDSNGKYYLDVDAGDVLMFSFTGYKPVRITYTGQDKIDVKLEPNINLLDEVVVHSSGFEKVLDEHVTGSFISPKIKNINKERTSDNVLDLMEGRVSGLRIDRSLGGSLSIRGRSSLETQSSNRDNPLIVVDGFEIIGESTLGGNSAINLLKRLNPEDIESVTVLKDAAASSIWGAKAANGVIVITTKKGKKSPSPNINLTSSVSMRQIPRYRNSLSVEAALEVDRINFENGNFFTPSPFFAAPANSIGIQTYYDLANGNITQQHADAVFDGLRQVNLVDEYRDLFLRTSFKNRTTLSIDHATDDYSYYASFNYDDEKTNNVNEGTRRMMGNINLTSKLFKGVTLSGRINYSKEKTRNNQAPGGISGMAIYQKILDENGDFVNMPFIHPGTIAEYDATGYFPYNWNYNVKQEFDLADNAAIATNLDVRAELGIDLLKNLKLSVSYNYQNGQNRIENLLDENSYNVRTAINDSGIFIDHDNDFTTPVVLDVSQQYDGFGIPKGSFFDSSLSEQTTSGGRSQLNYASFLTNDQDHYLTALLGMDYRENNSKSSSFARLYGYDEQLLTNLPIDVTNDYLHYYGYFRRLGSNNATIDKFKDRFLSYYTNMSYTYKNKYVVTGSWRLDDSNLFGSSKKYRNKALWSVGGKWQMVNEEFLGDDSFVNQLDLRATHGTGGRITKGTTPFLTFFVGQDFTTSYPYATVNNLENQELRWEETTTSNLGLDFSLFDYRVSGSFEVYRRYTNDLLTSAPINPTYGFSSQTRNYGEVKNEGFDATLNYNVIANENFRWLSSVIFSFNENMVERYDGPDDVSRRVFGGLRAGDPLSAIYSYRWAGLSETGSPQVFDADGNIVAFNEAIDDTAALEYSGQFEPKYYGSFSNTFSYGNLSLSALLTYEFGHVFRKQSVNYGAFRSLNGRTPHPDFERRWQEPGDENTTDVPAYRNEGGFGSFYTTYYNFSSILVGKADNIRLNNVSLNYEFPRRILDGTFLKSLFIGFNAQDFGVIWTANKEGVDPYFGNGTYALKSSPLYSFSLRTTF